MREKQVKRPSLKRSNLKTDIAKMNRRSKVLSGEIDEKRSSQCCPATRNEEGKVGEIPNI